ncbi:MAG: hypothetical protein KDK36_13845 [Leptospiraceae bacterium]|nr:hypothetical protein [Leptospiraceae bacterium]
MKKISKYISILFYSSRISKEDFKDYFKHTLVAFSLINILYILAQYILYEFNKEFQIKINKSLELLYKNHKISYFHLKLQSYPYSLISGIFYIIIFLLFCIMIQYLFHLIMGEKKKDIKKLVMINILSFNPFYILFLITLLITSYINQNNLNNYLLHFLLIGFYFSLIILGIIIFALIFIKQSKRHFSQNTGRAFLTWISPMMILSAYVYNIIMRLRF